MATDPNRFLKYVPGGGGGPGPAPNLQNVVPQQGSPSYIPAAPKQAAPPSQPNQLDYTKFGQSQYTDEVQAVKGLTEGYMSDKRTEALIVSMPNYLSGLQTSPDGGGDQALVYAFAKVMDPIGAVQQGESKGIREIDTLYGQLVAKWNKELQQQGGDFRPEVRQQLRREMTTKIDGYIAGHNQAREYYVDKAKYFKIPPEVVVGKENLGAAYSGQIRALAVKKRENAIREKGLNPAEHQDWIQNGPDDLRPPPGPGGPGQLGPGESISNAIQMDKPKLALNPEQSAIYNAWAKLHPNPTPEQHIAFFRDVLNYDLDRDTAEAIGAAQAKGATLAPGEQAVTPAQKTEQEEAEALRIADKARAVELHLQRDEASGRMLDATGGWFGGSAAEGDKARLLKHGMTLGLTDEASGLGHALANPLTPFESYRAGRDEEQMRVEEARARSGWLGTAAEVGGGFLSANPEAILPSLSAVAMRTRAAKQGFSGGVLSGWGQGRGFEDSTEKAAAGGVLGTVIGTVGGHLAGGRQEQFGIDRAAAGDLARMGREQDVRINAPMIPGNQRAVNQAARLESEKGSEEVIQQGFADTASDIGRGVQRVGGGGTVSDDLNLGINMRGALEAGDEAAKKAYQAEYKAAEAIDGDPVVEPTDIVAEIDKRIAKLQRSPNENADAIKLLRGRRDDLIPPPLADGTPAPPKDWRLSEIRKMRTRLRDKIKGGHNRTSAEKDADAAMMDILDGVNSDIKRTLSPEAWDAWKKADASFAAEQTYYKEVTKKIFGNNFDELSPEETVKRINAAGKGNTLALERMVARLSPQAQQDLAATTASNLGKITGENGEDVFSAARFITQARGLSKHARQIYFGPRGAAAFDDLLRLGRRLEFAKTQINVSKTTRGTGNIIRQQLGKIVALAMGGLGAGLGGATYGVGGLVAGGAGMVAGAVRRGIQARTLMDPKVTRILAEGAAAGTLQDARMMASRLSAIVARQPEYAEELQPMIDQIQALGGKGNKADLKPEDTE